MVVGSVPRLRRAVRTMGIEQMYPGKDRAILHTASPLHSLINGGLTAALKHSARMVAPC